MPIRRIGRLLPLVATAVLLVLQPAAPAGAALRVGELRVGLAEPDLTVHVGLLDAIPLAFREGLHTGLPALVRYTVELWQDNRAWPDQRVHSLVVERQVAYNVVTREFRVTSLRGEARAAHVTRALDEAGRVIGELRDLRLVPLGRLDRAEAYYVRVQVETILGGVQGLIARWSGAAEQASRQSEPRALVRVP